MATIFVKNSHASLYISEKISALAVLEVQEDIIEKINRRASAIVKKY